MVQYWTGHWPYYDDYWKLTRFDTDTDTCKDIERRAAHAGYQIPSGATKTRLLAPYARAERGLLNYHGCKKTELKAFCSQRGLATRQSTLTKPELIQLLESVDDGTAFGRFIDLPIELRILIYELYFENFPPLPSPSQPPITQVSRLVRKETLPIFYKSITFIISVDDANSRETRRSYDYKCQKTLAESTQKFLRNTATKHVRMIRKLCVDGRVMGQDGFNGASWTLKLGPRVERRISTTTASGCGRADTETADRMEKRLGRVVDVLVKSSERKKLDFRRFAKVFQEDEFEARGRTMS